MDGENRVPETELKQHLSFLKSSFFGSYDHSIDAKGRIIIPTAYRKALGESFTLTVDADSTGIAIYPDEAFQEMAEQLYRLDHCSPAVQEQLNHVFKFSYPSMTADSQGRVVLPAKLRQYVLGDARDVEISGALDHIRIVENAVAKSEDHHYKENHTDILNQISRLQKDSERR